MDGASLLRALYFQCDFGTGVIEGERLVAASPKATEAKAWYALHLARSSREDEAVAMARAMTAAAPRDAWAWFALAGALTRQWRHEAEAIAPADTALGLLPGHADMIWMRAQALARDPKHADEAIGFVDRARTGARNLGELLVVRGSALYASSNGGSDPKVQAALATFEEARRVDPACVNGWLASGETLNGLRRSDEALPLLRRAAALAPDSASVRREYWRAVTGSRELTSEQKRQVLEADVVPFLEAHGNRPAALAAVAGISAQMKWTERQRQAEDRLLRDFNGGPEVEWVYVRRWRAHAETPEAAWSPERRQVLREFVARPRHYVVPLLGEAYLELMALLAHDPASDPEELYRAGMGVAQYDVLNPDNGYVNTPATFADRGIHLADAERLAREGLERLTKKMESERATYTKPGEYEHVLGARTGPVHAVLGWVLLGEGRTADAEKELLAAYDADREDRKTLYYLGRLCLQQKNEAKAEQYFAKGLTVAGFGPNPCETALRSLYEGRPPAPGGFETYLATLKDADRGTRMRRVLAGRLPTPGAVAPFDLKTLDGRPVSLASLQGKIVVINFWGTWCGWCVKELPEYQKLFETYAKDPAVAILTIANDANPEDIRALVTQKRFTFPVLVDDRYVSEKAGIGVFPTTWFLDRQGRTVFVTRGASENLFEEFSWRIEAMRK